MYPIGVYKFCMELYLISTTTDPLKIQFILMWNLDEINRCESKYD